MNRAPCLLLVLLLPWMLGAQPTEEKSSRQPHLRYLCSAGGNVPPQQFGEWPLFKPALRLAVEGGPSGPQILASSLLPLSSGGYQPVSPAPGKIVIQSVPPDPQSPPVALSSLDFKPKPGRFYTLLISGGGTALKLDLLEDEPAILPPAKEGEEPPPPRRSLRCLVLEPGTRVKISCPGAGLQLENTSARPALAENLKAGLWTLEIEGEIQGQPFTTTLELDLESPGNWSLFFMKDIYGRIGPALKKDASLD